MDDTRNRFQDARRQIVRQLLQEPRAFSIDGHTFGFTAPIDFQTPVGGYVSIRTEDGRSYLGQISSKQVVDREGPELSVAGDAGIGVSSETISVNQTAFRIRYQVVDGYGSLLGRAEHEQVALTTDSDTFSESSLAAAPAELIEMYVVSRSSGKTPLDIGTLRSGDGKTRGLIQATGFDRHTFLCGQSGSGKTYALGVVLERLLLETDLPIIIIDPNSDFVNLGGPRTFDVAKRGFADQFDSAEAYEPARQAYERAAANVRVLRRVKRGTTADNGLRIRFSDLALAVQGMVLQLDPLADLEVFNAFNAIRSGFGDRPYSLTDVRTAAASDMSVIARDLALRIANLGIEHWDIWAEADELPLLVDPELTWRALVLDIGGFTNMAEQSLVALGLLNFLWNRREARKPVLVVVDEAHNICPQEPANELQAAATDRAVQIAGEGRKFGIYFLVSTQRPQKLHANVISQCDNLFLMRMNSSVDIEHLAGSFSFVPTPLLASSSWFTMGESLIAGKVVPSPMLVRFGGRYSQEGGGDIPATWANPKP